MTINFSLFFAYIVNLVSKKGDSNRKTTILFFPIVIVNFLISILILTKIDDHKIIRRNSELLTEFFKANTVQLTHFSETFLKTF
jgi:hypothetical protein